MFHSSNFRSLRKFKQASVRNPELTVAVRIKNEELQIGRFIASLQAQVGYASWELLVLDSGSEDATLGIVSNVDCSLYTIESSEFSFGETCNLMMELSRSSTVAFFSGHVFLARNDILYSALRHLADVPAGAGFFRQIPNPYCGLSPYEAAALRRRFPTSTRTSVSISTAGSFSNAASILRKEAWIDNRFDVVDGSEDFLWATRHVALGRPLLYFPNLPVMHSHGESADQLRRRVALNVRARYGNRSLPIRGIYFFIGVFFAVLMESGRIREAIAFAKAHAMAYIANGRVG
jgi:glycosyltransferase involved in cell wall biosynthesis